MKDLFKKNQKLLKELLKEQAKVKKPDLSKEIKKLEEFKSLLNK